MGHALRSDNKALAMVLLNMQPTATSPRDGYLEQLIQDIACKGMP